MRSLHDAILSDLRFDWSKRVCVVSLRAFLQNGQPAEDCQILLHGVTDASVPHCAPWGESSFVNTLRVDKGTFVIEMQSGDEIRIAAESFDFK